jgi:hypothetical protein
MRTGQQDRPGESTMARPASATASLEVPVGTAGVVWTGVSRRRGPVDPGSPTCGIRLLPAEEVSPLGDIPCWA